LVGADPVVLGRGVAGASGADARDALALAMTLPRDGAGYDGTVLVESEATASAAGLRVTFEGYRDDTRAIDGVIVAVGSASLTVDLDVTVDEVTTTTSLALACDGQDLCHVAADSWISIGDLGVATILGAWRHDPRGGYLTLAGAESLTFDFNAPAAAGCIPYTVDGEPGSVLCDEPVVP
jgi:hypothetical protein